MSPTEELKDLSKVLGVSMKVVVPVLIIGLGFVAYKNYLESTKLKLEIAQRMKDLDVQPVGIQKVLLKV